MNERTTNFWTVIAIGLTKCLLKFELAALRPDIFFLQTEHFPEMFSVVSGVESCKTWLKL